MNERFPICIGTRWKQKTNKQTNKQAEVNGTRENLPLAVEKSE